VSKTKSKGKPKSKAKAKTKGKAAKKAATAPAKAAGPRGDASRLRVLQFGMGPIGVRAARLVASKRSMELVGAVDVDPRKVGIDAGELDGGEALGVEISADAEAVIKKTRPHVALHTTSSGFATVAPQLELLARAGCSVVSSTEEMLFPALKNAALADKLDKLARSKKVVLLGTGVNPGFVMDTLPLVMTAVCYDVRKVHVDRRVDAGTRRLPLQLKVGAGITVGEFNERKARGAIGHVGLPESMALLAHGLGWKIEQLEEELEPMIAPRDLGTAHLSVKTGQVAGIKNTGRVIVDGEERITLDLRMYVGCEDPHDQVSLSSTPPIEARVTTGVAGDLATAAMLVNMAARAAEVAGTNPGLRVMTEMTLPRLVG
jgi:4-hydroxy-tetrahydrodipicolinate reductase